MIWVIMIVAIVLAFWALVRIHRDSLPRCRDGYDGLPSLRGYQPTMETTTTSMEVWPPAVRSSAHRQHLLAIYPELPLHLVEKML